LSAVAVLVTTRVEEGVTKFGSGVDVAKGVSIIVSIAVEEREQLVNKIIRHNNIRYLFFNIVSPRRLDDLPTSLTFSVSMFT
jgi:hypothetical protein